VKFWGHDLIRQIQGLGSVHETLQGQFGFMNIARRKVANPLNHRSGVGLKINIQQAILIHINDRDR
jgi:hypothetical protein